MNFARVENNVVINIEVADQQWVDAQPDPTIFIPYSDSNPASIGCIYDAELGKFIPPVESVIPSEE